MSDQMPQGEIYDLIDKFRRELLRQERTAATAMVKTYGRAWQHIKSEMERLNTEYEGAKARGERPTWSWIYQHNRLSAFKNQVEQELSRFAQYAEGTVLDEQRDAVRAAQAQAREFVEKAMTSARLEAAWNQMDPGAIETMVGVTQNGPLHRLFLGISENGARGAEEALVQAMLLGKNPRQAAREMRQALGTSLSKALTIARTETLRVHREATLVSYRNNSDIISGWIWHSAADERTCAACWAMHGTKHTLDEKLDGHPNDRCAMVPILKGLDFEVKPGIEMFAKLPEIKQIKILGPAKWAAWKDGKVTLDEDAQTGIVGRTWNSIWGSMRHERSLADVLGEKAKDYYHVLSVKPIGDATRLKELADTLLPEIENILGVKSYWSGKLTIEDLHGAYGVKNWNCTIGIDRSAIQAGKMTEQATLLHELLHSFSVGGDDQSAFIKARGWEEGVVERSQQVWNVEVYRKIGVESKPGYFAYERYTNELEKIRFLTGQTEKEFYTTMMTTLLADRKKYILNLASSMNDDTKDAIQRIIRNGVLDW